MYRDIVTGINLYTAKEYSVNINVRKISIFNLLG